jgi:isoleucyl-tRNA synthetase
MNSNVTVNDYKSTDLMNLPRNEENILKMWKDYNILNQIKQSRFTGSQWNFLDGPPFVNGNPHHGHLLVSTIKDVLARYHSNLGYQVSYQIGFDCHGLPMEQAAENEIGKKMSSDATITEISDFNKKCQEIQDRCSDRFETVLSRLGRQFESDKTYYTSKLDYMNALWISFKKLFDKGLIYRGKKVMPYSYGCQTALSNFEANQNYKQVSHTSLYLKFKLAREENEFFLVWTTTPWSLLANQALCLNPELEYLCVESRGELFWIAKELYPNLFKNNEPIIKSAFGKDLINIEYYSPFNYFNQSTFVTLNDTYVTSESGTGIVHIAPLFGADDFRVCMDNNIINSKASNLPDFLDSEASIKTDLYLNGENINGMLILNISDMVIDSLKLRNLYFKKDSINHKYPFCWRTDTPLIYLAQDCWFLDVQKIKGDLIENNSKIQWFPEFVGSQRFNNWLEGAPDWCLSRNRFWGTPIPIWKSDDDDYICISSMEDLQTYSEKIIDNLHREFIDDITIVKDGKVYKRIDAVFDCWYESGLAGIAKEGDKCRDASYPVDFVAESLDQTRGWFYTLNVLSTALYNKPAFKKVIVSGLILASDGMKMSKRLNNYTPPEEIMNKYGADILRLYLLSSPATQAQEFRFTDSELIVFTRKLLPYFHAHKLLFESFENLRITSKTLDVKKIIDSYYLSSDKLDNWINNLTDKLSIDIKESVEKLELYKIPMYIFTYIDNLTNIWVKFSRDRLKNNVEEEDTINAINTLYQVLHRANKIMSPFMPFNTDYLYNFLNWAYDNNNVEYNCIHLLESNIATQYDNSIIESMNNVYTIIEMVRSARQEMKKKYNRPTNSPIGNMVVYLPEIYRDTIDTYFDNYIMEQCNIEHLVYSFNNNNCMVKANRGKLGKLFRKEAGNVEKLINESKVEDILDGKVSYNGVVITSEYYQLCTTIKPKENYYSVQNGMYQILLDTTLDETLVTKFKLSLWKREIQDLRRKLNFNIWDNLELLIDKESYNSNKYLDEWKDYFEKLLNSKVRVINELKEEPYVFNYEDNSIKYQLNQL